MTTTIILSSSHPLPAARKTAKLAGHRLWVRVVALIRAQSCLDPRLAGADLELRCLDASTW